MLTIPIIDLRNGNQRQKGRGLDVGVQGPTQGALLYSHFAVGEVRLREKKVLRRHVGQNQEVS